MNGEPIQFKTKRMLDNELAHVGVLGMHWGKRKNKGGLTNVSRTGIKDYKNPENSSNERKSQTGTPRAEPKSQTGTPKQKAESKPHPGFMTDTELKNRIARIQLENQYRQLTTPPPSATKKFVSDVLMTAFKSTATAYTTKYMTKGLESLMKQPPPPPPPPPPRPNP